MRRRSVIDQARAAQIRQQLTRPSHPLLADVIERNIAVIELLRQESMAQRSMQDRIADAITNFAGSMTFLYVHAGWFLAWIAANLGWIPGLKPFDPFPFGLLTMIVSLEAIFLSTLVMVSQNRQAVIDEHRASLDLQIDLLAEYEVTRMLRLVDKIAAQMGIEDAYDEEIDQLCQPVAADVVLKEIDNRRNRK